MASHPTKLFLGIVEPRMTIFYAAGEPMGEMNIVTLDPSKEETVKLCGSGDVPFGFVTQNVTVDGISQYGINGLLSRTAKVGDKVGIYIGKGILKTDKLAEGANIDKGSVLYAGTSGGNGGYFTDAESSSKIPVGIADNEPNEDGIIRFKSLL